MTTQKPYIIPLGILMLSMTSWPISYLFSKYKLMENQLNIFVAGVVCLSLATVGPYLIFKSYFKRVDPLLLVWSVFSWSCMIDLGIGLELNGQISNFIGYYFAQGEPYLMTSHGCVIDFWDGTVHFTLCIAMVAMFAYRKSHRELALVWIGSIVNSMVVLLPGGVTGDHPVKLSIMLNTPYLLCPVYAAFRMLNERPPQARTFLKYETLLKRPVDLVFFCYFVAASCFAVFVGLAILGGNANIMRIFISEYEPYLKDPTTFPRWQTLAYSYLFLAYYLYAMYGLMYPGSHRMTDWALIHAGAAAQAQVTYIWGSYHHLTPAEFQSPRSGPQALTLWCIHLLLLVAPSMFALYCLGDHEKYGRANAVIGRADNVIGLDKAVSSQPGHGRTSENGFSSTDEKGAKAD